MSTSIIIKKNGNIYIRKDIWQEYMHTEIWQHLYLYRNMATSIFIQIYGNIYIHSEIWQHQYPYRNIAKSLSI